MNAHERVNDLLQAAGRLAREADELRFAAPVAEVYNPLDYAWAAHSAYLRRFAASPKRVVFLGMNPGPWGMAQTGVPFGEIAAVRDWMGISAEVERPAREHPKRPIEGFACTRSEVSGRRLWGLMAERFASPEAFFADHFVANYCPLVFMEETGRNRTPDKLPRSERDPLFAACDAHLRSVVETLRPAYLVGVGKFAENRIRAALATAEGARDADPAGAPTPQVLPILHPSPASPAANRDWSGKVTATLEAAGIW